MILKGGLAGKVFVNKEKYSTARPGEYFGREIGITHIMGERVWME